MTEKTYDFKVGDKVRLTGSEWVLLTGDGVPREGDIVTIIRIDDNGDRVFESTDGHRYGLYGDWSAELVTEKPKTTVTFTHENGDRITLTDPVEGPGFWGGDNVSGVTISLCKRDWTPEEKNYPDNTIFVRKNFYPLIFTNGKWHQILPGFEGLKSRPARPEEIEMILLGEGGTLVLPGDLNK